MGIKDKLEIVLITYNRCDCLKSTLDEIFADNSPVRDFDITILDNSSTDGTRELIEEYKEKYPNIKYIINRFNIGGCANISKALVELPNKEYVWVICDNDTYDWTCWGEIEKAIENDFDVIFTRKISGKVSDIFYKAAFLPACIYKTKNITNEVAQNIYDGIRILFPHLALIAKNINDSNRIYSVSKDIVIIGKNENQNLAFTRGNNRGDMPQSRRYIFWSPAYFQSIELIKDKKKREEIIDNLRHYHKTLFELFQSVVIKNELYYGKCFNNYFQIFRMLNFKQKLKFIFAYLSIKLLIFFGKDYSFYEISKKEEWKTYLDKINEQKYIDKLSKKLKDKKVLFYGAGLSAKVLFENYDLSKFNVAGICDKKFEKTEDKEFNNFKAISPDELKNLDYDVILFTMKLYKKIEKSLKNSGINKKTYSLIKKDNKYAVRF